MDALFERLKHLNGDQIGVVNDDNDPRVKECPANHARLSGLV